MSKDIGICNGLSVDPPWSWDEHHIACDMSIPEDGSLDCTCDSIYDDLAMDAAEARRDAANSGDY